jgi:hypothetical protein
MNYDNDYLRVDYRNKSTFLFKKINFRPEARLVGARQIKHVRVGQTFNVKGQNNHSFIHASAISKHTTEINNMVQLRPWLRDVGCGRGRRCERERQGSFGVSLRQYDLVAAHLT